MNTAKDKPVELLVGDIYNYKGINYVVIATNYHVQVNGIWIKAVAYYVMQDVGRGFFVRGTEEFLFKFRKGWAGHGVANHG